MKYILAVLVLFFFSACSKSLHVEDSDYNEALIVFEKSCDTQKTRDIYTTLCQKAQNTKNAKEFFQNNFVLQKVSQEKGLLTGYYEASLKGSLKKSDKYRYPVYGVPKDLIVVELSKQYEKLKSMRLRGRLEGNIVVPYYSREEIYKNKIDADVICYVDSKVDLFFLEVQGSGRIELDNAEILHVGYGEQNGYPYSSIGKYLVSLGEISQSDISMQSISEWFKSHPNRVDEILIHNKSYVFFKKTEHKSKGSLGVVLTPKRSIAVDTRYVKLGSLVYLVAKDEKRDIKSIVMAQDTGGAIKGKIRADMFMGYGDEAMREAGDLKADLELYMMLPKKRGDK
jgi:membrane-bound lytic murein transglycosylase A